MKAIFVPAYDRPHYFKKLLESVKNAEDYRIYISVDYSHATSEVLDVANEYKSKFKSMEIGVNNPGKGMELNTYEGVANLFDNYGVEFLVILEDDLYLAPDFFLLMDFYYKTFKDNPMMFGAYGAQGGYRNGREDVLTCESYFTGRGWALFKENWEQYFKYNFLRHDYGIKHFNARGCDWNISGTFREFGVMMIMPELSRSRHEGVYGKHHDPRVFENLCEKATVNKTFEISNYVIEPFAKAFMTEGWMDSRELQWLNATAKDKVVIEMGCWCGRSTLALYSASRLICVDLWAETYDKWKEATKDLALTEERGDLYDKKFQEKLIRKYKNSVDMVFIDALHDYESVKSDIKLAEKLLKKGGVLCGHDYSPYWSEVIKAVDENFKIVNPVFSIWVKE